MLIFERINYFFYGFVRMGERRAHKSSESRFTAAGPVYPAVDASFLAYWADEVFVLAYYFSTVITHKKSFGFTPKAYFRQEYINERIHDIYDTTIFPPLRPIFTFFALLWRMRCSARGPSMSCSIVERTCRAPSLGL